MMSLKTMMVALMLGLAIITLRKYAINYMNHKYIITLCISAFVTICKSRAWMCRLQQSKKAAKVRQNGYGLSFLDRSSLLPNAIFVCQLLPWLLANDRCGTDNKGSGNLLPAESNVQPSAPPLPPEPKRPPDYSSSYDNPPDYSSLYDHTPSVNNLPPYNTPEDTVISDKKTANNENKIDKTNEKRAKKKSAKSTVARYLKEAEQAIKKCEEYEKKVKGNVKEVRSLEGIVESNALNKKFWANLNIPFSDKRRLEDCKSNLAEAIGNLQEAFSTAEKSLKEMEQYIRQAKKLGSKKIDKLKHRSILVQGQLDRMRNDQEITRYILKPDIINKVTK